MLEPDHKTAAEFVVEHTETPPEHLTNCEGAVVRRNGRVKAAVVYYNHVPGISVEIAGAIDKGARVTRGELREFIKYPFGFVPRVEARTSTSNEKAHKFLYRMGFTLEGRLRRAWDGESDSLIWSLTTDDLTQPGPVCYTESAGTSEGSQNGTHIDG